MISWLRGTLGLTGVVVATAASGCVMGTYTGQTVPQETTGYIVPFSGYIDTKYPGIIGYSMKNPDWDPLVPSNYLQISPANVVTSGPYSDGFDTVPFYTYSFNSTVPMDQTKWPRGGLGRFRVTGKFNGNTTATELYTFDNEGLDCVNQEALTKPWRQVGIDCRTPYMNSKYITAVSTVTDPSEERGAEIEYLSYGGDHQYEGLRDPIDLEPATDNYYASIQASRTLDGADIPGIGPAGLSFKKRYGYPGTGDVHAIYYNQGDLGIARDMHCWSTAANLVACYVTNFGRRTGNVLNTDPIFGKQDPQTAINQAINQVGAQDNPSSPNRPIATVAMVYDPSISDATARTQFMVYNEVGDLDDYAALDEWGVDVIGNAEAGVHSLSNANINVPDNCMTCHAASGSYFPAISGGNSVVHGAAFLPFDAQSFVFSTAAATLATYGETPTMAQIKKLNSLVLKTTPSTSQIASLIKGLYPDPMTPGPDNPVTTFSKTYIPPSWTGNKTATQLYNEVVKPYCRTCHVTANQYKDWDNFSEFMGYDGVWEAVCTPGEIAPMPQAQQVQDRFWKSPARGHLAAALGASGACRP